jgi:hypothetical protein
MLILKNDFYRHQNDKDKAFTYSSVKKFIEKPLKKVDLELLKENEYLMPFFTFKSLKASG